MVDELDPIIERIMRRAGCDPETWWEGHHELCSFGGFSCLFWISHPDCPMEHPGIHNHSKETVCPSA